VSVPPAGDGAAPPPEQAPAADPAVCYRHPDREAHIRCVRCERRICPDCMIPASVGFQCPECVRDGNKSVRRATTVFGGRVTSNAGYVTKVLIAINVVGYVVQQAVPSFDERFEMLGLARGSSFSLEGVAAGEYYRLITAAFMHASPIHIALNMYALYLFGPPVEAALGRARYLALYLLAALGGNALSYAFAAQNQPSLGASGAVFGLLGAFFVVNRKLGRETGGLVVLIVINFAFSFVARGIDWRAHLGGMITGALVALALAYAPPARRTAVQAGAFALMAVVVAAVVIWRTAVLKA
jgi:membrane associated rhomboid family serine protease